jgi:hypothetical protein
MRPPVCPACAGMQCRGSKTHGVRSNHLLVRLAQCYPTTPPKHAQGATTCNHDASAIQTHTNINTKELLVPLTPMCLQAIQTARFSSAGAAAAWLQGRLRRCSCALKEPEEGAQGAGCCEQHRPQPCAGHPSLRSPYRAAPIHHIGTLGTGGRRPSATCTSPPAQLQAGHTMDARVPRQSVESASPWRRYQSQKAWRPIASSLCHATCAQQLQGCGSLPCTVSAPITHCLQGEAGAVHAGRLEADTDRCKQSGQPQMRRPASQQSSPFC